MPYVRKTEDLHVVQMFTSCGWEDVAASTKSKESRADLKAYRENDPTYLYRLIRRRVKI